MNKEEILDDNFELENQLVATKGARIVNYIIDKMAFWLILILHAFVLDGLLGVIPEGGSNFIGFYFFFLYVFYHSILEYYFGKTLGKFLTYTIVVKEDGSRPGMKTIIVRNLCRLIPFDPFSFFFSKSGWHDQISKTKVVYNK